MREGQAGEWSRCPGRTKCGDAICNLSTIYGQAYAWPAYGFVARSGARPRGWEKRSPLCVFVGGVRSFREQQLAVSCTMDGDLWCRSLCAKIANSGQRKHIKMWSNENLHYALPEPFVVCGVVAVLLTSAAMIADNERRPMQRIKKIQSGRSPCGNGRDSHCKHYESLMPHTRTRPRHGRQRA